MARPVKIGLDYFPLDVDIFTDFKVKIVRGRYGSDGVLLYIYLLCEIYKNCYYLNYNSDVLYCLMADLNMSEDKTRQIINFLLERSLFDDTLFQSDKVLTAASIQRRYQEACRNRKRDIEVVEKFWVLDESETLSFIKMHPQKSKSENNSNKSENNSFNSENYSIKESKVKESKVKDIKVEYRREEESNAPASPPTQNSKYGEYNHVKLTDEQYQNLVDDYGQKSINEYIKKIDEYCQQYGKTYKDYNLTMRSWLKKDNVFDKNEHSYDLDEIYKKSFHTKPSG